MIRVFAFVAILCGCLLVFGGLMATNGLDRMSVKALTEPRLVTVIITLRDADDRYRWLSVYACSAALTSENVVYCTGQWERESSQEIGPQMQHLIHWRDLPRGTLWITGMAFDGNQKLLARGQTVVFRGE